ncbi:unnamed protein product [Cuscuta epithymum]|uniref:Retrovirus-related Pol polyprotein from transposon TNT 1-94-like beta-barrel domain-containing protein n=1 Tax=Cuscuta epithymum TaxID=186058 RepID=A0AAV0EDT7_9ASTE|nr:unnamed protein product [Cuscuta epithymum]
MYNKFLQFIKTQNNTHSSPHAATIAHLVAPIYSTNTTSFLGKHIALNSFINSTTWILDTGASDHMIYDAHLYTSMIKPISIKLQILNGYFITATQVENVQINNNLTFHNVLYVPEFHFNLISVLSLVLHDNLSVSFTSNHASLQDQLTNKIIGYADLKKWTLSFQSSSFH